MAATDDQVGAYYEKALVRFRGHDYEGALVELKNALQRDAQHLPTLVLMGQTLLELGQAAAAQDTLERARRLGAGDRLVLVPLARAYLAQGEHDKVLAEIDSGDADHRLRAEILTVRGEAQLAMARPYPARESFEEALRHDPRSAGATLGLAKIALTGGRLEVAAAHTVEAVQLDADDEEAWHLDGEVRRMRGDPQGALESYGRAIERNPRYADPRIARAAMLVDAERDAEAVDDIDAVLEHHPAHPQAAYLQALVLARKGELDRAREVLSTARDDLSRVEPSALANSASAVLLAGVISYAQDRPEDARRHLERYLELEPDHPMARQMLGVILVRADDAAAAVGVLEPARRAKPDDVRIRATLGTAYLNAGRFADAVTEFEAALALDPSLSALRVELARSLVAAGRLDAASTELETLMASDEPLAADAGVLLGQALFNEGRLQLALAVARRTLERFPGHVPAHLLAGDTLLAGGDTQAAVASYRRALEIEPAHAGATLGLARASQLGGDLPGAAKRYEELLARDRDNVQAMVGMARLALAEGRTDDAVDWLKKARAKDRNATVPQIELVNLHLALGDTQQALYVARELERAVPDNVMVLHTVARAELAAGESSKARSTYARVRLVPSATATDLARVAEILLRMQDARGAREALDAALERDPDHLPAHAGWVAIHSFEQNHEAALEQATRIGTRYPQSAIGPTLRGDVSMATGRFEAAVDAYAEAQTREPGTGVAVRLYRARLAAGQAREAIAGLERWVDAHPEDAVARRALAVALLSAGRLDAALALHEQLVEESVSDDPELLNNLGWLYQKHADPRALATAERAYELAPDRASILDTYGWILLENDQPARALSVLREAQAREPDNPWVQYHTALALSRLDRRDEARDLLRSLVDSGRSFDEMARAKALLDRLSGG